MLRSVVEQDCPQLVRPVGPGGPPDIELLEQLTGESFADWKGDTGRGDFRSRSARSTPS